MDETGDYVEARMYAGRVTITGRVVETREGMYRVRVETVDAGDWPYPPKVGQTPWVADREIVHQHAKL